MDYLKYTTEDYLADETFINYCLQTNEDDVAYWKTIISHYPELKPRIEQAKKLCFLLAVRPNEKEKSLAFQRLKGHIEEQETSSVKSSSVLRMFQSNLRWISAAACLLLVMGGYLLFNEGNRIEKAQTFALQHTEKLLYRTSSFGERKTISLSDGTTVVLNGNSQLYVSRDYNDKHRVVWLDGDAFFDVAKDQSKPFVVQTSSTITTALGTSFRVKNFKDQAEPFVMLRSGSVQVSHLNDLKQMVLTTLLKPGEQVTVTEGNNLKVQQFTQNTMNDWLARHLVFDASKFDEIKNKLFDIYGVSLIADSPIAQSMAFTGKFENEKLTEILDAISFSNRIKYTVVENKILLTKLTDH